jgi:hypothetical protein
MVSKDELSVVRPFWFVRENVFKKDEILQIRFYNNKSGNLGGRFMSIEFRTNSDCKDFRIEFAKNQRDLFINSLKENNYNVVYEF